MKTLGKRIAFAIIIIIWSLLALSIALSKYALTVTHYSIQSYSEPSSEAESQPPIRLILLTDLHNREFGEENGKLIENVRKEAPDLIAMAGDMINKREEKTEVIISLVEELSSIAPVYYSYGNHELEWIGDIDVFRAALESAGATVLERSYEDITVNGREIRIGGIYGYCPPVMGPELEIAYERAAEQAWMQQFQWTDRYKILLCHIPLCWIAYDGLEQWDVDLVLSGHNHGGQIRLPLLGGLFVPDMGWFPGKVSGRFESSERNATLIDSPGLGNESFIPRINDLPEIIQIDIE